MRQWPWPCVGWGWNGFICNKNVKCERWPYRVEFIEKYENKVPPLRCRQLVSNRLLYMHSNLLYKYYNSLSHINLLTLQLVVYIIALSAKIFRNFICLLEGIYNFRYHLFAFHLPSPLAPDPIMVQSCVCCLLWTKRNSMVVISIFLSISLSN